MGFVHGTSGDPDQPVAGPPRWVKVFAVAALVVLAAFLIMLASGHRGPGRHIGSLDAGESSHPPPAGQGEHRP